MIQQANNYPGSCGSTGAGGVLCIVRWCLLCDCGTSSQAHVSAYLTAAGGTGSGGCGISGVGDMAGRGGYLGMSH